MQEWLCRLHEVLSRRVMVTVSLLLSGALTPNVPVRQCASAAAYFYMSGEKRGYWCVRVPRHFEEEQVQLPDLQVEPAVDLLRDAPHLSQCTGLIPKAKAVA